MPRRGLPARRRDALIQRVCIRAHERVRSTPHAQHHGITLRRTGNQSVPAAGEPSIAPHRHTAFAHLDDKWLFAREVLEAQARTNGFETVRFVPHHDHESLYRDITQAQLRMVTGEDQDLPAWAIDILDSFDRALPPAVKRLLMLEGSIVLSRAA